MAIFGEEFMAVEVFACRLASCDEEEVVSEQAARIRKGQKSVDEHGKGHSFLHSTGEGATEGRGILVGIDANVSKGERYEQEGHDRGEANIGEEEAVIPSSDTIV